MDGELTKNVLLRRMQAGRKILIPTLRVVAGLDMLRFVTLHAEEEVVIGRDPAAGLVLADASVSRRHCRITATKSAEVTVQDLGSTNGTAVNGAAIERSQLNPGDHLEVGAVSLRLDLLTLEEIAHLERVLAMIESRNRDPLTGLLTRTFLDEEAPLALARADRELESCSVLFLDVDNFRAMNEKFGHSVADDVLVSIARIVLLGLPAGDAAVRYGGEEVLLFLWHASCGRAVEVAERLRRTVSSHDWSRTAPGLRATVSIGVAERARHEPLKEWISRADHALYHAKATGRDRVVAAGAEATALPNLRAPDLPPRVAGPPIDAGEHDRPTTVKLSLLLSCYISYSRTDARFAERLHDWLTAKGVRCWKDDRAMLPGDDVYEGIRRGVEEWDRVLLCCSAASLQSWWVDVEVGYALDKERRLKAQGRPATVLVPLDLDGALFDDARPNAKSVQIRARVAADFSDWEAHPEKMAVTLETLLASLKISKLNG